MKTLPLVKEGPFKRQKGHRLAWSQFYCLEAAYRKSEVRFGQVPAKRGGFRDIFSTDVAFLEDWCACGC